MLSWLRLLRAREGRKKSCDKIRSMSVENRPGTRGFVDERHSRHCSVCQPLSCKGLYSPSRNKTTSMSLGVNVTEDGVEAILHHALQHISANCPPIRTGPFRCHRAYVWCRFAPDCRYSRTQWASPPRLLVLVLVAGLPLLLKVQYFHLPSDPSDAQSEIHAPCGHRLAATLLQAMGRQAE